MEALVARLHARFGSAAVGSTPDERALSAIEAALNREIDVYRDRLKVGFPKEASERLQEMLGRLPGEATPYILYRIQANIGHCLLQLSDVPGGLTWLEKAVKSAPREPKAIATKAFAHIIRKEFSEAIEFAQHELAVDSNNEDLAAHLIEACIDLDDGTDPEPIIPIVLRERERVLVARCLLYRHRGGQPTWWTVAQLGAKRFPKNHLLKLFAAEAEVDQIARATRNDTYRPLTDHERGILRKAAETLDAIWLRIKASEVPCRDDGLAALSTSMVAHRLLEDGPKAKALASELIETTDYEPTLLIAVQVALAFDDEKIAARGSAKLPSTGDAGFVKGVVELNRANWEDAVAIFAQAEVPEQEKAFVERIVGLAPLNKSNAPSDETALERARLDAAGEPRALVVIARLARRRGFVETANRAYNDAVALVGPGMPHPARVMLASYAYDLNDFGIVIRTLDGHVDIGAITPELQWLSDAHASETPTRNRNARFYERLPETVRRHPEIARGHASVLVDVGRYREAEAILRRLVREIPGDSFSHKAFGNSPWWMGMSNRSWTWSRNMPRAGARPPNSFTSRGTSRFPSRPVPWAPT